MTAGKMLHTFNDTSSPLIRLAFNPQEFMMATLHEDQRIRFHDLETFEAISESPVLESTPRAMDFHPDGNEVMIATENSLEV
jgi:hypothetical protein